MNHNYLLKVLDSHNSLKETRPCTETEVASAFPREDGWLKNSTNSGRNMTVKFFNYRTVQIHENW